LGTRKSIGVVLKHERHAVAVAHCDADQINSVRLVCCGHVFAVNAQQTLTDNNLEREEL
jgi:hypothetical protein